MGLDQAEVQERIKIAGHSHPIEIGCPRRNVWAGEEVWQSWAWAKGNLILRSLATSIVDIPGFGQAYLLGYGMLAWRAGTWQDYWLEDIREQLALLVVRYGFNRLMHAVLLWENKGKIRTIEIPLGNLQLLIDNIEDRMRRYNEEEEGVARIPPRIRKDEPRAVLCHYCPVKARCDGMDQLVGDTTDWPDTYKAGPSLLEIERSRSARDRG